MAWAELDAERLLVVPPARIACDVAPTSRVDDRRCQLNWQALNDWRKRLYIVLKATVTSGTYVGTVGHWNYTAATSLACTVNVAVIPHTDGQALGETATPKRWAGRFTDVQVATRADNTVSAIAAIGDTDTGLNFVTGLRNNLYLNTNGVYRLWIADAQATFSTNVRIADAVNWGFVTGDVLLSRSAANTMTITATGGVHPSADATPFGTLTGPYRWAGVFSSVVTASMTVSGLTPTHVVYAGAAGLLSGDAGLTYDAATDALTLAGTLNLPATTGAAVGVINQGGAPLLHTYSVGSVPNLFLGQAAGNFTTTATVAGNIGIGAYALRYITTGRDNYGFGYRALGGASLTGNFNYAFGRQALFMCSSGSYNFASGAYALCTLTTGTYNVGMGVNALRLLLSGNHNTTFGSASGYYVLGSYNLLLGSLAGTYGQNLTGCVYIGYAAGYAAAGPVVYDAAYNVYIGNSAGQYWGAVSNKLCIHSAAATTDYPLLGGDFSTPELDVHGILGLGSGAAHPSVFLDGTVANVLTITAANGVLPAADGTWLGSAVGPQRWTLYAASIFTAGLGNQQVAFGDAAGQVLGNPNLTFNNGTNVLSVAGTVTANALYCYDLTPGRVVHVGAADELTDAAGFAYSAGNFTVPDAGSLGFITGDVKITRTAPDEMQVEADDGLHPALDGTPLGEGTTPRRWEGHFTDAMIAGDLELEAGATLTAEGITYPMPTVAPNDGEVLTWDNDVGALVWAP